MLGLTVSALEFACFIDYPDTKRLGVVCSRPRCVQGAGKCNTVCDECRRMLSRKDTCIHLHFGSSSLRGETRHVDMCKVCSMSKVQVPTLS